MNIATLPSSGRLRVFISYEHGDAHLIREVVRRIREQHEVFFAEDSITAGQDWTNKLESELARTEAMIVFLTSPQPSKWVSAEVGRALELGIRVIPIKIAFRGQPLSLAMQALIGPIQSLDWDGKDVPGLCGRLEAALGGGRPEMHPVQRARTSGFGLPKWVIGVSFILVCGLAGGIAWHYGNPPVTINPVPKPDPPVPKPNPPSPIIPNSQKDSATAGNGNQKPENGKPRVPSAKPNEPPPSSTPAKTDPPAANQPIAHPQPTTPNAAAPINGPAAIELASSGRCEEALGALEAAAAIDSGNATLLYWMGRCRNNGKDYTRAAQNLTRAISSSPRRSDLFVERARSYASLGDSERAREDVDRALALDSKNLDATELRGDLFMQSGNYEDALNAYDHVFRLGQTAERCRKLAEAYRKTGASQAASRTEQACRQIRN